MFRVALCSLALLFIGCGDDRKDPDNVDPTGPQCGNGIDDDGDGKIDFPDDPGCESSVDESEDSPALPACSDHRDNDGDGKIDFPDDPGCLAANEDDESDDCPDGPECPACANGIDDDVSGSMDYPGDPGCESAGDPTEFSANPIACGATMTVTMLPISGIVNADLDGASTSSIMTKCGGGGGSAGHAYAIVLTEPKIVVASTSNDMTAIDTVIDIRRANCSDPSAHVACNDDTPAADGTSELTVNLDPGVYYIIVEGHDTSITGPYQLVVKMFSAEGSDCTNQNECAPGLFCQLPASGGTQTQCTKPRCSDTADNDGDGITDFPGEPGCDGPTDNDETDDCPTGPNCPACSNDTDDDGDKLIDFPADTGCGAASSNIEGCGTEQDPILTISSSVTTGTTTGAHDDFTADSCGIEGGLDVQFTLNLPAMSTLTLDTSGSAFDSTVSLRTSTCGPIELDCDDDGGTDATSLLDVEDLAAGLYVVVVDGFGDDDSGNFTLAVSGTIAPGGSCEGALFAAGVITCETGATCEGTLGARTCVTQCSDGIDNNGDGLADFPEDPGCTSLADATEDTVCPGAGCPACADTTDNDGDGDTDFPDDQSCDSASDTSELDCPTTEPVAVINQKVTTGTTVGQTNDLTPTCSSGTAPDVHLQLDLPKLDSLSLVLVPTFDADLVLYNSTCGPAEIVCRDSSVGTETITQTNVAEGRYFIEVDGDSTGTSGTFTLTTTGVIAPGGSCESPLFTAGAFTCAQNLPCTGPTGAKKCQSECSDGVDNDGDGLIDFPEEPGCTTIADDSELDTCPNGVGCPQCSNGIDDDGDGLADFGNDLDCVTAATNSEGSQCFQTDPVADITSFFTNGTTTGKTDDIDLSCGSSAGTGPDVALRLQVPKMRRLSLDLLLESGFDSVHALLTQQCTQPALICRDPADLDFNNLAAGTYFVVVDGFNTGEFGVFTLLTSGEIEAGGSCEGPLFESGAITCVDNLPCEGTPGQRTCRSECSDGVDNNADGLADFPEDPGCASPSDLVEDTLCPGANCPQCADTVDNDGNGAIDFPDDPGCLSASDTGEQACPSTEPVTAITTKIFTGTTTGATNDFTPTCGAGSSAPDRHFSITLPQLTSLSMVLTPESGYDADLALFNQTCGGTALGCGDGFATDTVSVSNVAAGTYFVEVDGDATGEFGSFSLSTTGVIAPGGSCTSPLFTDGALTCTAGQTCNGTVCQ